MKTILILLLGFLTSSYGAFTSNNDKYVLVNCASLESMEKEDTAKFGKRQPKLFRKTHNKNLDHIRRSEDGSLCIVKYPSRVAKPTELGVLRVYSHKEMIDLIDANCKGWENHEECKGK